MKKLAFILILISGNFAAAQDGNLNFDTPQLEVKSAEDPSATKLPSLAEIWNRLTPSFDARMIYLAKESPKSGGRQGFAVMSAIFGLDIQIADDLVAVGRYNLGFLGQGVREVYLDYQAGWIDSVKVGRFPLTFGLRLYDHRIYTKKFFVVSYNDFETGLEASKEFGNFKVTASVVQGRASGEAFQNNEQMVAPALDIRWDFDSDSLNGTIGASGLYTFTAAGDKNADTGSTAAAVYYRLNFWKLTHITEIMWGEKRNNLVMNLDTFVGDAAFANNLKGKQSAALFTDLEFAFSQKWKTFYEYHQAMLDTQFMADRFEKHAVGLRWAFHPNSDLELKLEKNLEGRKANPNLGRNNDALLITLHAWL